jgi:hypothetical protein
MNTLLIAMAATALHAAPAAAVPDVAVHGPKGSVITVVVDSEALRASPHRRHYELLVQAVPDYQRVVGQSGMDPIDVYDRVLMSSTDPTSLTETVLVATSGRNDKELSVLLDTVAGEKLAWKSSKGLKTARPEGAWWVERGDPRVFMRAGKGTIAFAKPGAGAWFTKAARKARKKGFPPKPAGGAVLVADIQDLGLPLSGAGARLPRPARGRVAVIDGERPEMRILLTFKNEGDASGFLTQFPGVQSELVQYWQLAVLGYTKLVARIAAQPVGKNEVLLSVKAEPREVQRLCKFLSTTIRNRTKGYRAPAQR